MRKLLVVILVAAAAWSGYWFIGATAVKRGVAAWFETQDSQARKARYSDLAVRGFPNRFDTTLTDPVLADPARGIGWQAPFFQILALSYDPTQIIAIFPNAQTVSWPGGTVTIGSSTMRASVDFVAGTDLELDHAVFVADEVTLGDDTGWGARLTQARLATRPAIGVQHGHDLDMVLEGLDPGERIREGLGRSLDLPPRLDPIRLDSTLAFDAPLDRFAIGSGQPTLTAIEVSEARIAWGPLSLRAAGEVSFDTDGLPEGRITIEATRWRAIIGLAVSAGLIPQQAAGTAERALELLSTGSEGGDTLELPLTFAGGRMSLGPVDLGPVPRLRR